MRRLRSQRIYVLMCICGAFLVAVFQNCSAELKNLNGEACSPDWATCHAGTYSLDANGLVGTLVISSVASDGVFNGTITNSQASASFSGKCLNGTIGFDNGNPYVGSYTSDNKMSGLFYYAGSAYPWSALPVPSMANPCNPGEVVACSDSHGSGTKTCNASSTYGPCVLSACAKGYVLSDQSCVIDKKAASLILVIGQSNAMNFGTENEPFHGGWSSDSRIQIWNGSAFVTYSPGINSNGDTTAATWGPEAEYARQWRIAHPNETLYIVKHAIGGVGLAPNPSGKNWSPFADRVPPGNLDWSPYSDSSKEFQKMLTSLISAANTINAMGFRAVLETALICNGETDTLLADDANGFQANLQMLLTATRARLQSPNMRAVLMRPFPNSTQGPHLYVVRSAIEKVGGDFLNAWVNTDDLTPTVTPNDGHFVPASVVTLGSRMFASDQAIDRFAPLCRAL